MRKSMGMCKCGHFEATHGNWQKGAVGWVKISEKCQGRSNGPANPYFATKPCECEEFDGRELETKHE